MYCSFINIREYWQFQSLNHFHSLTIAVMIHFYHKYFNSMKMWFREQILVLNIWWWNNKCCYCFFFMLNTLLLETYVQTNHMMEMKNYDNRIGNCCSCVNIWSSHLFLDTNNNLKFIHTIIIKTRKKCNDFTMSRHTKKSFHAIKMLELCS